MTNESTAIRAILRDPLLHFFLLGAALFLLFGLLNREPFDAANEIVVDEARARNIAAQFERTWQRQPTAVELDSLIQSWIREEVFYREGLAMGLDRGDPVVRRRVAQRMQFISEDIMRLTPATADLEAWLEANAENYRIPAKYALEQRYFDPGRHGTDLDAVVSAALQALETGEGTTTGDATLLPGRVALSSEQQIERIFGAEFVAALAGLPVRTWAGPVESGFGTHIVRIDTREPGRDATLQEVRAAVERDYLRDQAEALGDRVFEVLRDRYVIRVETGPGVAGANGEE